MILTSTKNMLGATFRNVLKVARDDSVIDDVPDTPRTRQKDNPRPFIRFYPLVDKEKDAYKPLLATAKGMGAEKTLVRGVEATGELYDLILFVVHTFVRKPPRSFNAIKHADIRVAENPKRLLLKGCPAGSHNRPDPHHRRNSRFNEPKCAVDTHGDYRTR